MDENSFSDDYAGFCPGRILTHFPFMSIITCAPFDGRDIA